MAIKVYWQSVWVLCAFFIFAFLSGDFACFGNTPIFSLGQFFDEKRRARSEATIHAFDDLEQKVFHRQEYKALLNMIEQQKVRKDVIERVNFSSEDWSKLTEYLSLIEHFAVGVNYKTYDIKILGRLGKTFIINQWNKLEPIIDYKRKENENISTNIYTEFEEMVNNLKRECKFPHILHLRCP